MHVLLDVARLSTLSLIACSVTSSNQAKSNRQVCLVGCCCCRRWPRLVKTSASKDAWRSPTNQNRRIIKSMVDVHFANSQVKHFFQPSFFLESYREAFSEYQSLFYESFALSIYEFLNKHRIIRTKLTCRRLFLLVISWLFRSAIMRESLSKWPPSNADMCIWPVSGFTGARSALEGGGANNDHRGYK